MFLNAAIKDRGYFGKNLRGLGVSRYAVYRHAHATGLMSARRIETNRFVSQFIASLRSQQSIGRHRIIGRCADTVARNL
jgi:hypothetical protein